MSQVCIGHCARVTRHWMVAQATRKETTERVRSGPPCFEMAAEPSDPKGQGPLVRVPTLQVMVLTFMALLALVAADGGGNDELGRLAWLSPL